MVNLAIMNAVKNGTTFYYLERTQTVKTDYEYAYDRILMGVGRTKMVVPPETKKLTAYRQAGQAVTSLMTPGATPLHKITILPRGKDMGFTSSVPDKDVLNHTKKSMQAQIDVLMGGRVA
jgi:ATP-dependent metalloprotease